MTFDHDPRDQKAPDERTPEQREAMAKLEQNAELRQLATEALLAHENPQDYLHPDLVKLASDRQGPAQQDRITNVGCAAIAEHIMTERTKFEHNLHDTILRAYAQPQGPQGAGMSYAENIKNHYKEQGIDLDIPMLMGKETLKFKGVANIQDMARSGLSQPQHQEVLRKGIPLQHQQNPNLVIGPAPGDLHTSAQDYHNKRATTSFEGYAVYEIIEK